MPASEPIKGRGASFNPTNRFVSTNYEREIDWNPEDDVSPRTQILKDTTQTIIVYNNSPDVGFDAGINDHWVRAAGRPLVVASHGMAMTLWLTARIGLDAPGAFWSSLRLPDVLAVDLVARTVARRSS